MTAPDKRRFAVRADLCEIALKGRIDCPRFVEGDEARIARAVVPSRLEPDRLRPRDTEYLFGEPVRVFDIADGWAWVKSSRDGYVGYIDADALAYEAPEPTHRISAIRSHLYPAPELKRFVTEALSFGCVVTVVDQSGRWSQIADGQWIYSAHLTPISETDEDPTGVALRFLECPYLWGGRSSEGLDCSALVQFALTACGIDCPRDTDMQEAEVGIRIERNKDGLGRGDLVFWPGHVGIMLNGDDILHCNATDMSTRIWPLSSLEAHILKLEGHQVRSIKRVRA
ncbi:MAG: NlpC/P60 family protein [Alphaproteobacteria bacterium]